MVITAYIFPDYLNNFGNSSTLTLPSRIPVLVSTVFSSHATIDFKLTIDCIEQWKIVQLAMR